MQVNAFLVDGGGDPRKGDGRFIEDPAKVENIVFQTRGRALDAFEQGLADALTVAFSAGHVELPALVEALNAVGSTDSDGAAWTEAGLTAQLARSAERLFAIETGGDHV